jgi:hypothetical protein
MGQHAPSCHNQQIEPGVLTCRILLIVFALVTVSLASCGALTRSTGVDPTPPSITDQPTNQTVVASHTATFSVTASGIPPVRFQWMKNGRSVSGATSASYTTPATTTSDSGTRYAVVVTDSKDTAESKAATLTVTNPGQISASPSNLKFGDVAVGSSTTLAVTLAASGNSDVTFSKISIFGPGFNVSGASAGLIQTPGQTVTLDVTFAPTAGESVTGSVSVISDASNPLAVISLSGSGVQPLPHSVSLALSDPSVSNIIGYNVYRASVSGGPYAKLTPSVNRTTSFTDMTVQAGETYYYVATSVDSSDTESAYSNETSATIPPS